MKISRKWVYYEKSIVKNCAMKIPFKRVYYETVMPKNYYENVLFMLLIKSIVSDFTKWCDCKCFFYDNIL